VKRFDLSSMAEQSIHLEATISEVQKVLSKPLKPMRKTLSVVKFTSGHIEEITESNIGLIEAAATAQLKEEKAGKPVKSPRPTAAVTVAQPVRGCPDPDFDEAEIRATRVLNQFLTPDQRQDFLESQQFVVTGADSGHRYMLTSRHAPKTAFRHSSFSSVYDLDDGAPLCVHDWEVPAPEELLGVAMHLQIPSMERYVRVLPL
jgi:hypothetical protein